MIMKGVGGWDFEIGVGRLVDVEVMELEKEEVW